MYYFLRNEPVTFVSQLGSGLVQNVFKSIKLCT